MCYEDPEIPYALPLEEHRTWNNSRVLTYSLLLGKVTEYRDGEHVSSHGFRYPLRHPAYDANARIGHHEQSLHFTASPDSARYLQGHEYGSHRLAVLPAPKVWDSVSRHGLQNRCWHSYGATALFCLDCMGIELAVLTNPDFWQDLQLYSGQSHGIPLFTVWHKQKKLEGNSLWQSACQLFR
jgi:hypothetical protein